MRDWQVALTALAKHSWWWRMGTTEHLLHVPRKEEVHGQMPGKHSVQLNCHTFLRSQMPLRKVWYHMDFPHKNVYIHINMKHFIQFKDLGVIGSQVNLLGELQARKRICLKNKLEWCYSCPLASTHIHSHSHTHFTCTQCSCTQEHVYTHINTHTEHTQQRHIAWVICYLLTPIIANSNSISPYLESMLMSGDHGQIAPHRQAQTHVHHTKHSPCVRL